MHAAPYRIRVRSREQWETTVHKAGGTHSRRVAHWGTWKLHGAEQTAWAALDQLEAVKLLNPTSDVAVFFEGRRLTIEQLRYRARAASCQGGGDETSI